MNKKLISILLILLSLSCTKAKASHIVGGEVTYQFIKDSVVGLYKYNIYSVSISIYEDCLNGQPQAIAEDDPAYIAAYTSIGGASNLYFKDSMLHTSAINLPANFQNACVANIPATCLIKKTFTKRYAFLAISGGYVISYQRCCRNGAVVNVLNPDQNGSTYYCTIPGSFPNNSAVFKFEPAQIICLNNPLSYDNSATDADGDSLSYGFAPALNCCEGGSTVKPFPPLGPPFDSVAYVSGFSSQAPLTAFPALQIDPKTGLITGTPNRIGRYLVTVYCNEYRDGILINTIKREFQYVVTSCTKVVVADIPQYSSDFNTYIVDCSDYNVNFVNTSKGGFSYHWDFGVPGVANDTSSDFEPTFSYPDTGTFTVKLVVNPGSTCPDSITRLVKVYPKFHAAFSDSGQQCPGAPISFKDMSSSTIKPIIFWKWSFGDGDSSMEQNPVYSYAYGGSFNVTLISENIKDCVDTVVKQVIIDEFRPFAGNDTFIVKGEEILFDATGGTQYTWTPSINLSDTTIYDPLGIYPDTGTFVYYVHVISPYGCVGDDTVQVTVVNKAAFFVPTAFSPDGDGLNDIFRPVAVGYRSMSYFRVFNRWGQQVFFSNNLESGWDGTFKGVKAEIGTYYWEMSYIDRFGKKAFLKGDVELLR